MNANRRTQRATHTVPVIDLKSYRSRSSPTASDAPRTNYRARWPEVPMPKGAAWRPAARRRDYEKRVDWVRYLNRRAYWIYIEANGHPYRPPGRKATCQRYEDRRREKRQRVRHQRRIDNLPQAIEREQRI